MRCPVCGTEHRDDARICSDCGTPLISDAEYSAREAEKKSEMEKYRHLEMVQVHSVQGQIEADIIQSYLRSRGIESFTRGLAVHSVHPFTVDGMGEIRILVSEEDAEEAREAIATYLDSETDVVQED